MEKKGTLNILSIDFDYFQNVTPSTIQTCYPDGIDLPTHISTLVWSGYYHNTTTNKLLQQVGILQDELDVLTKILKSDKNTQKSTPVMIANSHVHIYDFIHQWMNKFQATSINLVNIDMHHDIINKNEELDCGNWISHIAEDFDHNCNISWICNPISMESYSFTQHELLSIETSIQTITDRKFDIIFLCRSDNWLAPHLDIHFDNLIQIIKKQFQNIRIETDVQKPRDITQFLNIHEQLDTKLKTQLRNE